jgi:hypothetical protein
MDPRLERIIRRATLESLAQERKALEESRRELAATRGALGEEKKPPGLRRAGMTIKQKTEYIRANGVQAYLALPM